jgi:apolipoprotein N-acyltransferase
MYNTRLIQWYDTTGVFGGSLWILVINLLLFYFIRSLQKGKRKEQMVRLISTLIIILVPISMSLIRYHNYTEIPAPKNIVVIQPNIDPYLKFNDIPSIMQTSMQIDEARKLGDSLTDYYVAPETSIAIGIWLHRLKSVPDIRKIQHFVREYPQAEYIVGIMCYKKYEEGEELSSTARYSEGLGVYYDSYNSAIQIDTSSSIPIYHKSQLVTGVEKMPYRKYLRFLEKIMVNLGGTFRSHGIQENRDVFLSIKDSTSIAPVICWESVFGEFVSDYIKLGAEYIFVITNDGWWGDTPGHRQHNAISCIRAIETRRSIARSANTGISCFINQRGDILQKLIWWEKGALKDTLNANNKITFYVKHGDYMGRIALFFAILIGIYAMVIHLISKKSTVKN